MDRFRVEVIQATPMPQQVIYAALHQDYSEDFVWDTTTFPPEDKCGEIIVKQLLAGDRGHYGPLEHPQITFACGYFPHSVMQQARTHRVGVSFDVQCLAGDTEITLLPTSEETKKLEIAELYDLWEKDKSAIHKMNLRVLNETTNQFEIGHIKEVTCSGIQPVYRLTLEDGKVLKCTANHRLLTGEGWQTMKDALGLVADKNHKVLALTKECELMCNGRVCEELVRQVNSTMLEPQSVSRKLEAHPVRVSKVAYLGLEITYDIEVEAPWHNFVANGIVVHNSARYTGLRVVEVAEDKRDIEDVFFLRPIGDYSDRQGKKYHYSKEQRERDLNWCLLAAKQYKEDLEAGMSEEHARGKLPFDYRQHFIVSFNVRSLMHFCDLRLPKNAQLEVRTLAELLFLRFKEWTPQVAEWYEKNRYRKSKLAP